VLRRPIEFAQYTSIDYTQTLDNHLVLASIGTVGDALDNALAESFVDSYKTELISDRVWRSRAQVELATVAWAAWFNHHRLHSSLGDIPSVFARGCGASSVLASARTRVQRGHRRGPWRRRRAMRTLATSYRALAGGR
jgi:putative transposase